jgi:hypothetical protein
MIIGIDFDGTCVTHEFPYVGKETGAADALKTLAGMGHKLVLFNMRSDKCIERDGEVVKHTGGMFEMVQG